MVAKGGGKLQLVTRKLYKEIKKMDRQQIENFLAKVYVQGYEDGKEAAEMADFKIKLVQLLEKTKGVGPKITEKILQTLKEEGTQWDRRT